MKILKSKWTPLFVSNFVGVFNDNLLKNAIIFMAVSWQLPVWLKQSQLISLVSASLILPYLFLSPLAGRWAVRYSRKNILKLLKLIEIPVMLLAAIAFIIQQVWIAIVCVLLMGILSCLYSPAKYSLIRDIGGEEGVSFGSGVFEMMAFLGILVGTVMAAIISDHYSLPFLCLLYALLAIMGFWLVTKINVTETLSDESGIDDINPVSFMVKSFRIAKEYPLVNIGVFGASMFWLIGGMLQMNLIVYCKEVCMLSNQLTGLTMAVAAIGIAVGCVVAGKASGKSVKKEFILPALMALTFFFIVLCFIHLPLYLFLGVVFCLAFSGGFFQVPCLAIVQNAPLGRKLGDVVGYLNLLTFLFVLLGTGLFSILSYLFQDNSELIFGVIAGVCFFTGGVILWSAPGIIKTD